MINLLEAIKEKYKFVNPKDQNRIKIKGFLKVAEAKKELEARVVAQHIPAAESKQSQAASEGHVNYI